MLLYLVAIILLLVCLALTILGCLVYFGLFREIKISTGRTPYPFANREIAFKLGKGKCADSSAIFTELCSILPDRPTIGLYLTNADQSGIYDMANFDPAADRYDYLVGAFTVNDTDGHSLISEDERKFLLKKGFRFGSLPPVENVVYSEFPFRGILSVVVAIRRVYPAINRYVQVNRLCAYPAVEIFDRDTIFVLYPLSQQRTFVSLISEASVDQTSEHGDSHGEEEEETASSSNSSFEEIATEDVN